MMQEILKFLLQGLAHRAVTEPVPAERALNGCDVLAAVLTPASYVSEICRASKCGPSEKRFSRPAFHATLCTDRTLPRIVDVMITAGSR